MILLDATGHWGVDAPNDEGKKWSHKKYFDRKSPYLSQTSKKVLQDAIMQQPQTIKVDFAVSKKTPLPETLPVGARHHIPSKVWNDFRNASCDQVLEHKKKLRLRLIPGVVFLLFCVLIYVAAASSSPGLVVFGLIGTIIACVASCFMPRNIKKRFGKKMVSVCDEYSAKLTTASLHFVKRSI